MFKQIERFKLCILEFNNFFPEIHEKCLCTHLRVLSYHLAYHNKRLDAFKRKKKDIKKDLYQVVPAYQVGS
jgi:hypothetical protein